LRRYRRALPQPGRSLHGALSLPFLWQRRKCRDARSYHGDLLARRVLQPSCWRVEPVLTTTTMKRSLDGIVCCVRLEFRVFAMPAYAYVYGPVPSRRLGKSMGINNIPAKVCSYACVYCQLGGPGGCAGRVLVDRTGFFPPGEILAEAQRKSRRALAAGEPVDYLTFVPVGEPTLDLNLGREITLLKAIGPPVGVITNSSLLFREEVRSALYLADWVSLKIDSVDERIWRRLNRPHKALRLPDILDGMLFFAGNYPGKLVTETMLVKGVNDHAECVQGVADFLSQLQPWAAYLSVPTRPPSEKWVRAPAEAVLNRAYHLVAQKVKWVEYLIGYEGNAFAYTGDIEKDILSITAVHPMRADAVDAVLERAAATWTVIERLVEQGDLKKTTYNGHHFYLRRFAGRR
jgi:wyosine [tRNA(Phe)-imidazoG37] synthetase (radical SAM superfamily)